MSPEQELKKTLKRIDQKVNYLYANSSGEGGGSISIPATAYASNADAVAALGVGVLYKSTTLINDSPIILITV